MEVLGTIKVINPTVQVSASFKKRELVVTSSEQYPQHILIEFNQDRCDVLNNYKVGDSVKVDINLRGREWQEPSTGTNKYFNSIQGWRISKTEQVNNSAVQNYETSPNLPKEEQHDDLPF